MNKNITRGWIDQKCKDMDEVMAANNNSYTGFWLLKNETDIMKTLLVIICQRNWNYYMKDL